MSAPTHLESLGKVLAQGRYRLALLTLAVTACVPSQKTVVVLVDRSGTVSPTDSAVYLSSFNTVLAAMEPGDRLIVAKINTQSVANYLVELDVRFPRTGIHYQDRDAMDSLRTELTTNMRAMLEVGDAGESHILDAISIAHELFQRDGARPVHWLIILSDMMDEERAINLRTHATDSVYAASVIDELRKRGGLPDLSGVRVWVAGAGGGITEAGSSGFFALRQFWMRYFHAAGAVADPSMYGRTALVRLP